MYSLIFWLAPQASALIEFWKPFRNWCNCSRALMFCREDVVDPWFSGHMSSDLKNHGHLIVSHSVSTTQRKLFCSMTPRHCAAWVCTLHSLLFSNTRVTPTRPLFFHLREEVLALQFSHSQPIFTLWPGRVCSCSQVCNIQTRRATHSIYLTSLSPPLCNNTLPLGLPDFPQRSRKRVRRGVDDYIHKQT